MSVGAPQASAAYPRAVGVLADIGLLAGAVTLRFPDAGGEELLAVPAGRGRLGGHLPVPAGAAESVVGVLSAMAGFEGARQAPDGRGGVLVVWGAVCPERISAAGRRRFHRGVDGPPDALDPAAGKAAGSLGEVGGAGVLSLADVVVVDALAHGTPASVLVDCRVVACEREVYERMAVVGERLTGWRGMTWTAVVHAAVCHRVVPVRPSRSPAVGPAGRALLRAWATGAPRDRLAALTGCAPQRLAVLEREVRDQLGARSDEHAVLRGHETGLLTAAAPAASGRGPGP